MGEWSVLVPDCHKRLRLLEGLPQKSQVPVARSLLESSGTSIPIQLCIPTDKPITLYRTTKVGMMEEVEERQVGERQYKHKTELCTGLSRKELLLTMFSEFRFETPYNQPDESPRFTPVEVL